MNKKLAVLLLGLGALSGCSSQPRQVEATIPLVDASNAAVGTKLPTQFRNQLEDSQLKALRHKEYTIHVGAFYTSSLGQDCRGLTIYTLEGEKNQRVACTEPKQYPEQVRAWYLVPNIVQSATSIQL